ncbi:amino acid ABC transporter substrate-binding protein [Elioraea tepida]|uniref:Amino acid ABC transporter substrate-binding protein n=1 Tax=Elioraea tepida TaxID=2843330 RepID=A0A975YIM7_9PROT|nr:amino acid ABC transporter substrate-binding protein [Elioraea tepida]QXM23711.1 amino acid ABC transporter substrate-binding protein [Elioraea tepida]
MRHSMHAGIIAAAFTLGTAGFAAAQQAPTFDAVKARGVLNCGVSTGVAGFSNPDSQGVWRGLDVDGCRAVAAAMFGDASKVRYIGTTSQSRFPALQSGEVDLLVRTTTWTLAREASLGFQFAGINFYDGQAFMVKRSLGVTSAKQLDGATVCVQPGTTTELNLADYFRTNRMSFRAVVIENVEEIRNAFISGRCDVYTSDSSSLASFRATQGPNAEQYVMLPEIISKEPLGPVVRKGDQKWFDLVRWTFFAQIAAEELGVTSANVDQMLQSQNPEIQRLLGVTGGLGQMLGVDNRWAYNIIKQVGNFEEIWERNITPIGVPRGINALWTKGGLMYAPPIR